MSWETAYDDTGISSYILYRDGSPLVTLRGTAIYYVDISAEQNKVYRYRVDATDPRGNQSMKSTEVKVSTSTQAILCFNLVASHEYLRIKDSMASGSYVSSCDLLHPAH